MRYLLAFASIGLAVAAFAGCIADDPEVVPGSDGGVDAAAASDAGGLGAEGGEAAAPPGDAGCDEIPGNLLQNPSFELTKAAGWELRASVADRTDAPAHCAKFLEVEAKEPYDNIFQYLDLSAIQSSVAPDAGVTLEFGMYLRSLDDNSEPVSVGLAHDSSEEVAIVKSPPIPPDAWVVAKGTLVVKPKADFKFAVEIDRPRKVGIDHAWVVRKE